MKKVLLEELPKTSEKGNINWKMSIGHKVKFFYDNIKGCVEIVDYDNKSRYLYLKYLDKDIFKIHINNFQNCKLGNMLSIITTDFKVKIGTDFKDDKKNLTIINREYRENPYSKTNNWKWYKYKCNICGWEEGWIEEGNLLKGQGCGCCHGLIVVRGINDIPTTAPWMIKFFQGGYNEAKLYTKSSNQKIRPICPDCGRIKDKLVNISNIYKIHSIGCTCGDGYSYPNKLMFSLLKQISNKYSPDWIKPKRYDFYFEFNKRKYIVEMDGLWHNKDNKMSGKTIEQSKGIDKYKDNLAKKHNIKVIRINSDKSELEYIKNNIINSELNNIFDLSIINWSQCEEFALSNLVKQVCDIKKESLDLTIIEICKIIGFTKTTIKDYLKKGTKLGWCDYNPKEEKEKNYAALSSRSKKINSKKVICLETNIIYDSITLAFQETKINLSCISDCCNGRQKTAGGYHWMHYDTYLKYNKEEKIS